MEVFKEIIKKSKPVDKKFEWIGGNEINSVEIIFNVPKFHPRAKEISCYRFRSLSLENLLKDSTFSLKKNRLFILDDSISKENFVNNFTEKNKIKPIILKSVEDTVKTKPFLDKTLRDYKLEDKENITLIVIGGGLIMNVGAYLAERMSANLILFPTTILAMADSSGGKVRVNFVASNRAYKHFYKSFYEPNAMFLDDRFILSLPKRQIQIGLVEIIKHSLFQSPKLYDFLFETGERIFSDLNKLKKAVLWAANLKKICMDIDIEENENGSRRILRGGHDFSDRLEEDLRLEIPHGIAVAIGIINQLEIEENKKLLDNAIRIFDLLDIPYSIAGYNNWENKQ